MSLLSAVAYTTPGSFIRVSPSQTVLRYANSRDLKAIDSLRKRYGSELGFVPLATYESIIARKRVSSGYRWTYEQLLVCTDNDDVTGFTYASYAASQPHASIVQICVREDARRMERALLMADQVEAVAYKASKAFIKARVAADIDAVCFWQAVGYRVVTHTTSTFLNQRVSNSRRPLLVFEKTLPGQPVQANLVLAFSAVAP